MEDQTRALLPAMVEARDQFMELVDEIRPDTPSVLCAHDGVDLRRRGRRSRDLSKSLLRSGPDGAAAQPQTLALPELHITRLWILSSATNASTSSPLPTSRTAHSPNWCRSRTRGSGADGVRRSPPPAQRSAAILKDVLGQSLEETAHTMGTTVGAVKAALSRRAPTSLGRQPRVLRNQRNPSPAKR